MEWMSLSTQRVSCEKWRAERDVFFAAACEAIRWHHAQRPSSENTSEQERASIDPTSLSLCRHPPTQEDNDNGIKVISELEDCEARRTKFGHLTESNWIHGE